MDFDGIVMPCVTKKDLSLSDIYAKPSKKLSEHLLEAGMMARTLLTKGRGKSGVDILSQRLHIPKEDIINAICFLVASHDIGKIHPGFQKGIAISGSLAADVLSILEDKGLILDGDEKIRHERYSYKIVSKYLMEICFDKYLAKDLATIIAYHHQGKSYQTKLMEPVKCFQSDGDRWKDWEACQQEMMSVIYTLFPISSSISDICDTTGYNGFCYFTLSAMVVSDWITSGSLWNEYMAKYKDISLAADHFVKDHMLEHRSIQDVFQNVTWEDAFPFGKNSLQQVVSEMTKNGFDLLLLEYPCGYGKTESSFIAAINAGIDKSGIYLATPTTSTAKGLTKRCREILDRLGLDFPLPEFDSSMVWSADDMDKIPSDLWTSKTRHQFLYPYACGTIDQALKSILMFRYACLGLFGLTDKVLIIDEVHAYDAYMLTELETLLKWCRFFKVPVILLSATLPTKTKERLFKTMKMSKDSVIDKAYPLVSMIKDGVLTQKSPDCISRTMPVSCIKTDDTIEKMVDIANNIKSGCTAFITPTVDDSFILCDRLREVADCEVILYQGRDTVFGKTDKIQKLLDLLGKDRIHRPEKLFVVATSIIEQSLDVDFDRMITTLAPIDLLIQRLGRVWRHKDIGTIREKESVKDPFTVIIPNKFGTLSLIYDTNILHGTVDVLAGKSSIDLIKDVRKMIDEVYKIEKFGEAMSEIYAGSRCIGNPFSDCSSIITDIDSDYQKFNSILPHTREETYPTVSIAILEELKDDYTYEEFREIMQKNVVNIAKSKAELFTPVETHCKYLQDMMVFVGKDLTVNEGEYTMRLTKDGLRIN